jgi:hypothetical protein
MRGRVPIKGVYFQVDLGSHGEIKEGVNLILTQGLGWEEEERPARGIGGDLLEHRELIAHALTAGGWRREDHIFSLLYRFIGDGLVLVEVVNSTRNERCSYVVIEVVWERSTARGAGGEAVIYEDGVTKLVGALELLEDFVQASFHLFIRTSVQ